MYLESCRFSLQLNDKNQSRKKEKKRYIMISIYNQIFKDGIVQVFEFRCSFITVHSFCVNTDRNDVI